MKSFFKRAAVSAAILASAAISANAQVIYSTGFEPTDIGYPGGAAETWKVSVFPPYGAYLLNPAPLPAPRIFTIPAGTFSEIYSSFNVAQDVDANGLPTGPFKAVYPFQNATNKAAATAYTLGSTHYPSYNFYGFYNSGQNGWESYVGNFRSLVVKSDDLKVSFPDSTTTALEHIAPAVADATTGVGSGGTQFARSMPPRSYNAITNYAPNLDKTAAAWAGRTKGNDVTEVDIDFYAPLVEDQGFGAVHGRELAGGGAFSISMYDSGHDYSSNPNCPDPNGQFTGYPQKTASYLIGATISNPNSFFGFGSAGKNNAVAPGKWHHLTMYYDPHAEVATTKLDGVFSGTEFVIQYPDCITGKPLAFGTVEIGVSATGQSVACPSNPTADNNNPTLDEDYFYFDNLKITAIKTIPGFTASVVTIPITIDSVPNLNAPVINYCTPFDQLTGQLQTVIANNDVPLVTVNFVDPTTKTIIETHGGALITPNLQDPFSQATMTFAVPAGHYDIGNRLPGSIRTTLFNVDATHDVTTDAITLLNGDATDSAGANPIDNTINFDDFLIFLSAFGSNATDVMSDYSGASNYDFNADFNYDSKVNFDDFLVLLNNFGLTGDAL